jgi:hypothetical protein
MARHGPSLLPSKTAGARGDGVLCVAAAAVETRHEPHPFSDTGYVCRLWVSMARA